MRVVLVGADFEENLGMGMIAAVAQAAGHEVSIEPFDLPENAAYVVRRVLARSPEVIGLSIQFQHRSAEFLELSRRLRAEGFTGHITAGGQFPTLAWREALTPYWGLDSIVLHEGERAFVALLEALGEGKPLSEIPGLALCTDDGVAVRTQGLPLLEGLDTLPFPVRYREHARHCNVPFIPIMGSRGCWGACSYCAITSFYRDARAHGGGKTLRHRSPENVAAEMATLWFAAGGPSLFCFHDDNFLLPRPADSLARVRGMRAALDDFGVGKVGLIGKCRPDSMTPELAKELRALGVIRLYVGVENASQAGSDHLNRRNQTKHVREALTACREAGIFVCYNLLVFEPDTTIADLRENIAFMREMSAHPVNFCRAEPYFGTPLHADLSERGSLRGSYLGFDYRIEDDRAELVFRIAAAAFRQRNFDPDGVANRTMGLGYSAKILEHFHTSSDPTREKARLRLAERTAELTRAIALETADFLSEAVDLAERHGSDADRLSRETALLGLRIARADRLRHEQLDRLYEDMEAFGAGVVREPTERTPSSKLQRLAQSLALSASIAVWSGACDSCGPRQVMPVDPVPMDPGGSTPPNNNNDNLRRPPQDFPPPDPPPPDRPVIVDPVPPPTVVPNDPVPPPTVMPPDPLPVPGTGVRPPHIIPHDPVPADRGPRVMPPDPLPRPRPPQPPPPDPVPYPPPVDPPPPPRMVPPPVADPLPASPKSAKLVVIDQWRDTSVRGARRSEDMPLFEPPIVSLDARREGDSIRVRLVGGEDAMSIRWEGVEDTGLETREVLWTPSSLFDQLRVAVRTRGGVAITSVRARMV
ncbi:MAG: radical SAM protein [Sandaracinus sp.]